jgi:hypothetical protein
VNLLSVSISTLAVAALHPVIIMLSICSLDAALNKKLKKRVVEKM